MLRQSFAKLRAINSGMTFHPARTQSKAPTPLIITIEQTAALRRAAKRRNAKTKAETRAYGSAAVRRPREHKTHRMSSASGDSDAGVSEGKAIVSPFEEGCQPPSSVTVGLFFGNFSVTDMTEKY